MRLLHLGHWSKLCTFWQAIHRNLIFELPLIFCCSFFPKMKGNTRKNPSAAKNPNGNGKSNCKPIDMARLAPSVIRYIPYCCLNTGYIQGSKLIMFYSVLFPVDEYRRLCSFPEYSVDVSKCFPLAIVFPT